MPLFAAFMIREPRSSVGLKPPRNIFADIARRSAPISRGGRPARCRSGCRRTTTAPRSAAPARSNCGGPITQPACARRPGGSIRLRSCWFPRCGSIAAQIEELGADASSSCSTMVRWLTSPRRHDPAAGHQSRYSIIAPQTIPAPRSRGGLQNDSSGVRTDAASQLQERFACGTAAVSRRSARSFSSAAIFPLSSSSQRGRRLPPRRHWGVCARSWSNKSRTVARGRPAQHGSERCCDRRSGQPLSRLPRARSFRGEGWGEGFYRQTLMLIGDLYPLTRNSALARIRPLPQRGAS